MARKRGSRFRRGSDDQHQLEGIEEAQQTAQGKHTKKVIESIEKSRQRLQDMLEQAIALKNDKAFEEAIRMLARTVRMYPDSASAWGLRGDIYLYELERPKAAIACFRRVTALAPLSEHGSLGLFHSLWQCGFHDKAIAEMKRFLSVSHSAEYAEIAAEFIKKSMGA